MIQVRAIVTAIGFPITYRRPVGLDVRPSFSPICNQTKRSWVRIPTLAKNFDWLILNEHHGHLLSRDGSHLARSLCWTNTAPDTVFAAATVTSNTFRTCLTVQKRTYLLTPPSSTSAMPSVPVMSMETGNSFLRCNLSRLHLADKKVGYAVEQLAFNTSFRICISATNIVF